MLFKILKKFACGGKANPQNRQSSQQQQESIPVYHDVDIRGHYDIKGLIGFPGSYGEVRVAVHSSTHRPYAVKMMTIQKHTESLIKTEIEIMKMIQHENVADIVAVYYNKKKVYIVMEKYDGGDLFDLVVSKGGKFKDEREAARIIKQILRGLDFLHSKHIAHCDVKLCNILLTGGVEQNVKLIDFGVSQIVENGKSLHDEVGSPSFIAPEVLMGAYNEKCDLWSLGCVVFILLFGFNPFNPKAVPALPNRQKICECILKGFLPEVKSGYGAWFPEAIPVSESARDFISGLLTVEWRDRLTTSEALLHPWILQPSES